MAGPIELATLAYTQLLGADVPDGNPNLPPKIREQAETWIGYGKGFLLIAGVVGLARQRYRGGTQVARSDCQ